MQTLLKEIEYILLQKIVRHSFDPKTSIYFDVISQFVSTEFPLLWNHSTVKQL